jgi:hypothetical protein
MVALEGRGGMALEGPPVPTHWKQSMPVLMQCFRLGIATADLYLQWSIKNSLFINFK